MGGVTCFPPSRFSPGFQEFCAAVLWKEECSDCDLGVVETGCDGVGELVGEVIGNDVGDVVGLEVGEIATQLF